MSIVENISERQLNILEFIIKQYVDSAKPIGSSLIAESDSFDLSPATIRNEMSELERMGYLSHLHTSGGRVPTDKAYRLFVNNIVSNYNLIPRNNYKSRISSAIDKSANDPRELNKNIARTLSDLSDNLVITNIYEEDDFFKTGLSSLFNMPEFREFEKAFRLTSFFEEFDDMFDSMQRHFFGNFQDASPHINVFIGRESPMRGMSEETIMCAKYPLPKNYSGSLTLIGPTRMDYEKNLSLIKYTVEYLNKLTRNINE